MCVFYHHNITNVLNMINTVPFIKSQKVKILSFLFTLINILKYFVVDFIHDK